MKRLLFLSFLGGCALAGGSLQSALSPRFESPASAQSRAAGSGLPPATGEVLRLGDRFEELARLVGPAVVSVDAAKPASTSTEKPRTVEESGSGVIVREADRGILVLTNNHVIAQAAREQITVTLADGRLLHPARVWADPESDVAVLALEAANLPTARLGDSDKARVGQWVLAIGSPFGLRQTVTHGIVSARDRGQISLGGTIRIKDFIQTDAAINPGSSGGPLVNLDGEVIGINTAIASHNGHSSGVAFSIPINLVKRILGQLLEKGVVARGYLGVQLAPVFEPGDARKLGLDRMMGALVESVYADTPAAAAGLRAHDVVLEVDGQPVRNENHLINVISAQPTGQKVRLRVWRDRRPVSLEAVVGDWSTGQGKFQAGQ